MFALHLALSSLTYKYLQTKIVNTLPLQLAATLPVMVCSPHAHSDGHAGLLLQPVATHHSRLLPAERMQAHQVPMRGLLLLQLPGPQAQG